MGPLRKNDIERARITPASERMRAAINTVNAGVRMRLATLRAKHPQATEHEIETALRNWLKDERTNS